MGTDLQRFYRKMDFPDVCIRWTAGTIPQPSNKDKRYGMFWRDGMEYAHRVAYEMFIGPIPKGLTIDHLCKVTDCVNPRHLEAVPHLINVQRGNGQKHPVRVLAANRLCRHSHWMDANNTYVDPRGYKRCRRCAAELGRRKRLPEREEVKAT
ncbi:hypothetical protein LCGC14_2583030 [marine sediment metagenome]|uniref:HNH nuclease domain-containing protein n=1 Tax=marine sediment metagenome TaxID=412755 RepID=A0A0F9CQ06_9ZZZZ